MHLFLVVTSQLCLIGKVKGVQGVEEAAKV